MVLPDPLWETSPWGLDTFAHAPWPRRVLYIFPPFHLIPLWFYKMTKEWPTFILCFDMKKWLKWWHTGQTPQLIHTNCSPQGMMQNTWLSSGLTADWFQSWLNNRVFSGNLIFFNWRDLILLFWLWRFILVTEYMLQGKWGQLVVREKKIGHYNYYILSKLQYCLKTWTDSLIIKVLRIKKKSGE